MRAWMPAVLAVIAGCGGSEPPAAAPPKPAVKATPAAPEYRSDPKGQYTCMMCNLRTNQENCPKCKMSIKPKPPEPPKSSGGAVGKTAVSPVYACPKEGCTYTDPRKGTCLKHADTEMKEQWFACAKCGVSEPAPGKCSKCSAELNRTLK